MTSVAGLTLREAILPLKSTLDLEELRTTKVEWHWTTTAGNERSSKMYLPVCDDPAKKELFIYVIDQFFDATDASRLHLTTGPSRYSKFRQVVEGSLRIEWQMLSDARVDKTLDNFAVDLRTLVNKFFLPSSRADQTEYLHHAVKPFNMTVNEVSSRLQVISQLARFLPGSWLNDGNTQPLYGTETEKKRAFFQLMPMAWRIKFAETDHRLEDNAYTYAMLTNYMSLQEAIDKRQRGLKRPYSATSSGGRGRGSSGGRGRGTPGRGRGSGGRGFGGRGYNRGNYGNYPPQRSQGRGASFGSPNPYIAGAQGGRFGGYGSPSRRGGYAGGTPPRVSFSPSPRSPPARGAGRGRGVPPAFPQFMAEDQYYQQGYDQQQQDQYAYDQSYPTEQEQYYQDQFYQGDDQYYQGDEQYYQHEEQYQQGGGYYDQSHHDQYYHGNQQQHQGQYEDANEGQPEEDAHFLQDFGY